MKSADLFCWYKRCFQLLNSTKHRLQCKEQYDPSVSQGVCYWSEQMVLESVEWFSIFLKKNFSKLQLVKRNSPSNILTFNIQHSTLFCSFWSKKLQHTVSLLPCMCDSQEPSWTLISKWFRVWAAILESKVLKKAMMSQTLFLRR